MILESNQNHARAEDTEVCPCLPASMGLGGGYVPMIVIERHMSDMRTITTSHNDMQTKAVTNGIADSLAASDYKDPPTVLRLREREREYGR